MYTITRAQLRRQNKLAAKINTFTPKKCSPGTLWTAYIWQHQKYYSQQSHNAWSMFFFKHILHASIHIRRKKFRNMWGQHIYNTFRQIPLKTLGIIHCLFSRGVGIQVTTHVFNLQLQVCLVPFLCALSNMFCGQFLWEQFLHVYTHCYNVIKTRASSYFCCHVFLEFCEEMT